MEGSVRTLGDRMHITAQLIRVSDQTHLWANCYDYRLDDAITVQNQVAGKVARSLGLELLSNQAAALSERVTTNGDAYLAYLKGQYHQSKRTDEGFRKSIQCFERAIQLDPHYALAYSGLADSTSLLAVGYGGGPPPKSVFPKAIKAALKALEINDNLAECHTSLAFIKYLYEWDWEGCERLLRRAIELNPSYAFARQVFSYYLSTRGRHQEAINGSQRACEFNPLSSSANIAVGMAYYFARQYEDAIDSL